MFDLNEIPEHAPDQFVEAEDLKVTPAALGGGSVKESKLSGHGVLPFVPNDLDEASTVTLERPAEFLPSRSSLSSALTFEPSHSPKLQQHGVDSKALLELKDEKGDEVGLTSNLLQMKQQQKQHQQQETLQQTDLCIATHGVAYQFMIGDASTSRTHRGSADASTHEDSLDNCEDEHQTPSLFPLKKTMEPQIHHHKLRNGHSQGQGHASSSADGSAVRLSLGGSPRSSLAHRFHDLKRCSSSSFKKADVFSLALGRSDDRPLLTSRKSSDLSPFWHGKLRTDAPLLTPVDAYCLGIMKPDSRLKKLPAILSSQKFVKLEEFMKNLRNGVTEPLTQFKPSLEASPEEVNRFNLMVEALSHGSGLTYSTTSGLGLDLGKKKSITDGTFPYSAALISWEDDVDYSLDSKLYLISSQSFQELVKNCQPNVSFGSLEEIDGLDPDSLYGIFCSSSSTHSNDSLNPDQADDEDAGRSRAASFNKRSDASLTTTTSFGERGKDRSPSNNLVLPRGSPSSTKRLVADTEVLTKSVSMETKRVSSRDSILRSDLEASGRGSKRRFERQTSSIDAIHDIGGKHLSRHSNGIDDLYEEDIDTLNYQKLLLKQREKSNWPGRHFERQDWRSDRIKDTARWSKEDRDAGKNKIKEHQRHVYHDNEKGWKSKTKEEQPRNPDKVLHKEKEKYSRDKVTESSKAKLSDKSSSRSKSSSSARKASPDHDSGKLNKKRQRDDERENNVHSKRVREATAQGISGQLEGETSCDLKVSDEQMDKEECLPQIQPEQAEKPFSVESKKEDHHSDNTATKFLLGVTKYDGINVVMDKEASFLDEEITKPLLTHRHFDGIMELKQEPSDAPVCETEGVSEMDTGFNLLKTESNWDDSLEESLLLKAEKEEGEESSLEFLLDGPIDKETRTWLMAKQNSLYLQQEYGVDSLISSTSSDTSKLNSGAKTDLQNGALQVRISMGTSEACDAAEAKWFVEQAASIVKSIALRGVYVKCLWYEGPVQIHPGDGAPSVPVIVKKIKGEDGKNLDRIQDETGVMIGVVLRKSHVSAPGEAEPMSRPRFIGLRLKCVRRKGLLEASKEAETLLECVAEHFSKELATHIATHIADLQEPGVHSGEAILNQDSPLSQALSTKELLPNSPVKAEGQMFKSSSGSLKVDEATLASFPENSTMKISGTVSSSNEEPEAISAPAHEGSSRPLFVSNLPEHITAIKIRNIFESVLKEKLDPSGELDSASELVVDVKYKPDKFCAFVELARDDLLHFSLKLYAEDKTVFHGLSVELGLVPFTRTERRGSFSQGGAKNKVSNSGEHANSSFLARNTEEDHNRKQYRAADQDSDSDFSQDVWHADNGASRTDYLLDKPRPLYLTELMRNASAPAIKQLFESIITTYIGPSLVNSSGKQLILDVRYVPTRGCAFVDLATPELVEFMLDLHSRRPEVFMNMKMELGRKAVPYSAEDDGDRRSNLRSRDVSLGKSQYGPQQSFGYRLTTSASRKKLEKRPIGAYIDYPEDSDKGDDLLRQMSRLKKQRSDPEKTIYADRLPESASEGMIKKIFERVLLQSLTREELDAFGEQLITEVRHVPTKYCAFVVFANEDLTKLVLQLYNQDEDAFESMRLKPHFHSRLEDLYKEDLPPETDEVVVRPSSSFRERVVNNDIDEFLRLREIELYDSRNSRLAVQRAITATAFKEVDRRRSVYVDRIPEDLNELSMTQIFEKVFRHHQKHGYDGHMVSQVAYFRDKFDPSKLCAFVEVKTEDGTQDLVDFYNANQDAFQGMRVRPGFKYST
eukprot:c23805_g1_i1 orf=344-5683(+)